MSQGMTRHALSEEHELLETELPKSLRFSPAEFERLWALHPKDHIEIPLYGPIPRWQQAYDRDYAFAGQVARALPRAVLTEAIPKVEELFSWCKETIDRRLNGLFLNWYDGALGHYIGPHRDDANGLVQGTPIVTISLGETRVFRLRRAKPRTPGFRDFEARDGSVLVIPHETNEAYEHEVPKSKRAKGCRISITLRAFA
jgi:alkylated DNA repair dioxygenase AlkB